MPQIKVTEVNYALRTFPRFYRVSLSKSVKEFWFRIITRAYKQTEIINLYTGLPTKDKNLQRRLYGMYTVCLLILIIPCNCKLVKSLTRLYLRRKHDFTLKPSYLMSFKSSLQSPHLLWVTLSHILNFAFLFLRLFGFYCFINTLIY